MPGTKTSLLPSLFADHLIIASPKWAKDLKLEALPLPAALLFYAVAKEAPGKRKPREHMLIENLSRWELMCMELI